MTPTDDLSRALAALSDAAVDFGAFGRILTDGVRLSPLQALLTEIGETVLAQDLAFHFADVGTLVLAVSERRIVGVRAVEGLALPSVADQLVGHPVSTTPDATQRALVGILMQLDLTKGQVEVRSETGADFAPAEGGGLHVAQLADLLGVAYPVAPETRLERLLSALSPQPSVYVTVSESEAPKTSGTGAEADPMLAVAEAMRIEGALVQATQTLSIIGQSAGAGRFIAIAQDADAALLWRANAPDIAGAMATWHKIFRA